MFLTQVEIKNFRNYSQLSCSAFSNINILFGNNGHGKTSFLEAIYCALRGRSFKPYIKSHFIKEGEQKAAVTLKFEEEEGSSEILATFLKEHQLLKKEIKYCGKRVGPRFLDKKLSLFVFTEASLKAIRQGPNERRSFIDQILISRGERAVVDNFNKILKEKNALLKSYKKELISKEEMQQTLEAIQPTFLTQSLSLTKKRLEVLQELFKQSEQDRLEFFAEPPKSLGFQYQIQEETPLNEQESLPQILEKDMSQKKELEFLVGQCFSGPHKHDICFLYNGQDSRIHCSHGQQRSLMLSLLGSQLNQVKKGLLFLDDVLMELDENNQQKFLLFLEKIHCQSFLTNCKKIQPKLKKMSSFHVKNGMIKTCHD